MLPTPLPHDVGARHCTNFSATPELYGKVIEAIDITLQSAATAAEMKKPGTGLVYIVEELRARDVAGSRDAHTAVKDNR
jgi:hypothetical protein